MRIAPQLGSESGEADCERRSNSSRLERSRSDSARSVGSRQTEHNSAASVASPSAQPTCSHCARMQRTEDGALGLRAVGGRRGDKRDCRDARLRQPRRAERPARLPGGASCCDAQRRAKREDRTPNKSWHVARLVLHSQLSEALAGQGG